MIGHISSDSSLPANSFRFSNNTGAAAIVYIKLNGHPVPVFIGAGPVLEPKSSVRVWLAKYVEARNMVDQFERSVDLDFAGKGSVAVTFDGSGNWVVGGEVLGGDSGLTQDDEREMQGFGRAPQNERGEDSD